MTEIGFYHLQRSSLNDALPKLLEKALQAGFRVLLKTPNAAETERLNLALWTYGQGSFLPHGTRTDGYASEQPIYLTEGDEVPNGADLACQVAGAEAAPLDPYKRVLDLFDGNDPDALAQARARWQRYRAAGHVLSYWQQTDAGAWQKKSAAET